MGKRNRVVIQKEAVTDDSSPSTSNRIRRWDDAEAGRIDELEPANDWNINLKGSGESKPEAVHDYFSSKKDKKKQAKSANLPSWMGESLVPTMDTDLERGTIPITKRDKYPERHSRI
jgi:hypothetical protein